MNILSRDKQISVISALTEGCSIRSVERLTTLAEVRPVVGKADGQDATPRPSRRQGDADGPPGGED